MFRFRKGLDVITLFHSPTAPASMRVHSLLKQASAAAGETATEDQASDHTQQTKSSVQTEFELNVIEDAPTPDQLKSILEYVGENGAGKVVQGATSGKDAFTKWKKDKGSFQRPLTVDWNNGKVVAGANESEILKLLESLPKE
ncbi:hypothetical protein V499_00246 [Pseudogymnoascus sp. VKM F-103]|uniref:Thioredoxin domain-containing protein n=1 Tax=Pseudogymnoascus verrucosus TaxID=342668 RepID=A0A1B8GNZ9_9PEZI|nr:uncharacterized protein VE01_04470 [Pseudogymnoascus verrucosus]KFY80951.1 hypothetical protein V499_00246 [Pseudogymnoascus sp. VKM F-103]OBT97569.1 hypothetical protein VE01_04470 [Pseudogymnoascus verrucosus]